MPTIEFKPVEPGNIGKIRGLFELTYLYEPVSDALVREKIFEDTFFDESLTNVVRSDGQIVGFSMGVTRPDYKPEKGWLKLMAIHPKFQGQSLGKQLLEQTENTFRQRGLKIISLFDTPYNYYTPGLDPRYTRALVFFQDRGFERSGETENLLCSLDQNFEITTADETRLNENGIDIHLAELTEMERLNNWLDTIWPAWKAEAATAQRQNLLYLAVKEGAVVGFGAGEGNNVGTGWFGPVGVDPEFRQYKIGKVLTLKVLGELKKRGFSMATIPWVGPIAFYQRLCKAVVDRVFWRFEKPL